MARQLARRQQRERLAGVLVVCLGIAVLVVAVIALREPKGHVSATRSQPGASNVADHSPSHPRRHRHTAAPTQATTSTPAPSGSAKDVPLVVLNNTSVKGLASEAAQRFRAGGWDVTRVDNLTNDILSTCAYYDPDVPGAQAAAEALQQQFPTIKRVVVKFPELPSGPVVVVLTPDYTAG